MSAPDAAAKEAERILLHGNANGLQLTPTSTALASTSRASSRSSRSQPDLASPFCSTGRARRTFFPAETKSKYEIWAVLGWPYETSCTMARLIFSGVTTRLPSLKILVHHLGAMIPFFDASCRNVNIGPDLFCPRSSTDPGA